MGTRYATPTDVYRYGVSPGPVAADARRIAAVDTTNDTLTLNGHGFYIDQEIWFTADAGSTLPSPLVSTSAFFAIPGGNDALLQAAASEGGAAVDLTTVGDGVFSVMPLIEESILTNLEAFSRAADRLLSAHVVPLTSPYPIEVVRWVALMTAEAELARQGKLSDSFQAQLGRARSDFQDMCKRGIPLRDATATASANLAESWGDEARAWGPSDGSIP